MVLLSQVKPLAGGCGHWTSRGVRVLLSITQAYPAVFDAVDTTPIEPTPDGSETYPEYLGDSVGAGVGGLRADRGFHFLNF